MKSTTLLALLALVTLAPASPLGAQTVLDLSHVDVGIGYDAGFDLHVHDEESGLPGGTEYAASEVVLLANATTQTTSPGGAFSFLGGAGAPVWVLPQTRSVNALWLGLGAEEIAPMDFIGSLTFSLVNVTGPGSFSLFSVGSFGAPTLHLNSGDGITAADSLQVITGGHEHYNWGFTAPGDYLVRFRVEGAHTVDGSVSAEADYTFRVIPEPSTYALAAFGLLGLLFFARRRSLA